MESKFAPISEECKPLVFYNRTGAVSAVLWPCLATDFGGESKRPTQNDCLLPGKKCWMDIFEHPEVTQTNNVTAENWSFLRIRKRLEALNLIFCSKNALEPSFWLEKKK
jgi:hypothetical protein